MVDVLKQPELLPDFSRIFTNFTTGRNHAVVEWKIVDNDVIINRIWGDFESLTTYDKDSCIGLSINNFLDEAGQEEAESIKQHALSIGFVAKKTAIYTTSGDIKYLSGIMYRYDDKTLIELMFNPVGIEL